MIKSERKYSTEKIVACLKDLKALGSEGAAKRNSVSVALLYTWAKKAGVEYPRTSSKRDWDAIRALL